MALREASVGVFGLLVVAGCATEDRLASAPAAVEVCGGGVDLDSDGQVDCVDPDCAGTAACSERIACTAGPLHLSGGALRAVDTGAHPFAVTTLASTGMTLDAAGYDTGDGFIYAIATSTNHVVRIAAGGAVTDLGPVVDLGTAQLRAGDVDRDHTLWVHSNSPRATYKIDLTQAPLTAVEVDTGSMTGGDLAYDPRWHRLYMVDSNTLWRHDIASGATTSVAIGVPNTGFHTEAWVDAEGFVYARNSTSNQIRRIDPATGAASVIGRYTGSVQSDGVGCNLAPWRLERCGNGIDDDGDGVTDEADTGGGGNACVAQADLDGDGVPDADDLDDDNDGLPDAAERGDHDGDGVGDWRDLDSDRDGVLDLHEAGHAGGDLDGDGLLDGPWGANGVADAIELQADSGVLDLDGDGEADLPRDGDGDGLLDARELDADGDAISDLVEGGVPAALDADDDGVVEGGDADGDGLCDARDGLAGFGAAGASPPPDGDGDGAPDLRDRARGALDDIDTTEHRALDGDGDGAIDDADDVDGDGIADAVEPAAAIGAHGGLAAPDYDLDGAANAADADDDGDGVDDGGDTAAYDPARCRDLDADLCDDCARHPSGGGDPADDGDDREGDGLCDLGDPDDDNDGVGDVSDADPFDASVCRDVEGDGCDDCRLTGADGSGGAPSADGPDFELDGLCDAGDPDDDNDGVGDAIDAQPTKATACRDLDADLCDDCSVTGGNGSGGSIGNDGPDTDGDGACNLSDADDDNDGVPDAVDERPMNPRRCKDADGDGCDDCSRTGANGSGGSTSNDGPDFDGDGACNVGDVDDDGDGVADALDAAPFNAHACRDADGDGCDDCSVTGADGSGGATGNDGADADADGMCDAWIPPA